MEDTEKIHIEVIGGTVTARCEGVVVAIAALEGSPGNVVVDTCIALLWWLSSGSGRTREQFVSEILDSTRRSVEAMEAEK